MSAAVTTRKAAEHRTLKSSSPAETKRKDGGARSRPSKSEAKNVKSEEDGIRDSNDNAQVYRREDVPTGETPSNFLAACSKLDLEPNPFEQSFGVPSSNDASTGGTQSSSNSNVLPPVAHMTSPSPLMPNSWGFNSLRSGPLSPAMLPGPQGAFDSSNGRTGLTPNESGIRTGLTPGGSGSMFPAPSPTTATLFGLIPGGTPGSTPGSAMTSQNITNHNKMQDMHNYKASQHRASNPQTHQQETGKGHAVDPDSAAANGLFLLSQAQEDEGSDDNLLESMPSSPDGKKRKNSHGTSQDGSMERRAKVKKESNGMPHSSRKQSEEEKRRNFLERNRQAALKCRQRKKQWLANLQGKVEFYSSENEGLSTQVGALREEIVNLKTLLLAHKECPVAHANGAIGGIDAINQAISAPEFPGPPNMGMLRRY